MGTIVSQITSLTIVYSTVYLGADQSKHQSSASLAFVWGIHRGPVNSPHKWPVTRKMFPFDDVIMEQRGSHGMCVYPFFQWIAVKMGHQDNTINNVSWWPPLYTPLHYSDVIMGAIASQITSLTIVYSIVYSDTDQRKHQSSAPLVNSPHKWPVTRKMFPFGDVIMSLPSVDFGPLFTLRRCLSYGHRNPHYVFCEYRHRSRKTGLNASIWLMTGNGYFLSLAGILPGCGNE